MSNTSNLNLFTPNTGDLPNVWGVQALNPNFVTIDSLFGASQSAGGHTHAGTAGSGPKIEHGDLLSIGSRTHAQIDADINQLLARIDEDSKIGAVRSIDAQGQVIDQVLDVSTLSFKNCTVEQDGAGFATVTPVSNGSFEITAPVVYFDAFVGPAGLDISQQSWKTTRTTGPSRGRLGIQSSGNGIEVAELTYTGWGTEAGAVSGSPVRTAETAFVYQADNTIPHSEVQRVGAVVERAEFTDAWVEPAPDTSSPGDNHPYIDLWLGIMQSGTGLTAVIIPGVWLHVRKVFDSATTAQVSVEFVVNVAGTGPAIAQVNDPTNSQQAYVDKDDEHFQGQHEMSLSKDPASGLYALHYYYNKGLIYRYQEPTLGDPFFIQLREHIATLEASPADPDFGHFALGISTRDRIDTTGMASGEETPRETDIRIDSFMGSSVGDRINPKFLGPGYQGDVVDPPLGDPVCPSSDPNPYGTLRVGQTFTPIGGGGEFVVVSIGSDSNGEFFIAQDSTFVLYVFYCSQAGGGGEPVGGSSGSTGTTQPNNNNNAVGVGDGGQFAVLKFLTDDAIPEDYLTGNLSGGSTISAGSELPAAFISGEVRNTDTSLYGGAYGGVPEISFALGDTRLPLGTSITAELDLTYDDVNDPLTATFSGAVLVAVPPASELTLTSQYYTLSAEAWVIPDENTPIYNGDPIALVVSGKHLPLGGFWEPGVGFGRDYRVDNNSFISPAVSVNFFEGGRDHISAFYPGNQITSISGAPTNQYITQGVPSDLTPAALPSVQLTTNNQDTHETVVIFGRLSKCVPINTTPGYGLRVFNEAGELVAAAAVFDTDKPEYRTHAPTITAPTPALLTQSTTTQVTFRVTYPAPDGFEETARSVTSSSSQVTLGTPSYTHVDNGPGQPWTVEVSVDVATPAFAVLEEFSLIYTDACVTSPLSTSNLAIEDPGSGTPSDPPAPGTTATVSSLYQCATRSVTLAVPAGNITAGDQLNIEASALRAPGLAEGFPYTYTSDDATNGWAETFSLTGLAGQAGTITSTHTRPGALNSTQSTITFGTNELPGVLTISGPTSIDYAEEVTLNLEISANANSPWAVFAWDQVEVSTSGSGDISITNAAQGLSDNYLYTLSMGTGWVDGDTLTLSVPNHNLCTSASGSTDFVVTVSVASTTGTPTTSSPFNGFPFSLTFGTVDPEDVGDSVEVLNSSGDIIQTLPNMPATGVIDDVWNVDIAEFNPLGTGFFTPLVSVDSRPGVSIVQGSGGSLLSLRMPPLPASLERTDAVGQLTEGSDVIIELKGNYFLPKGFDPSANFTYTVEFLNTQDLTSFVSNEITLSPLDRERRQFALNIGDFIEGFLGDQLSINIRVSHSLFTQYDQTYIDTFTITRAGGGPGMGEPGVSDLKAGF